jgi:hypothetical protein
VYEHAPLLGAHLVKARPTLAFGKKLQPLVALALAFFLVELDKLLRLPLASENLLSTCLSFSKLRFLPFAFGALLSLEILVSPISLNEVDASVEANEGRFRKEWMEVRRRGSSSSLTLSLAGRAIECVCSIDVGEGGC